MTSSSQLLSPGNSDTSNEELFATAPNSPEKTVPQPLSPERRFVLPAPSIMTPLSVSDTQRSKKKVSWSPLPPQIGRVDHSSQSYMGEPLSLPLRPRTPSTLPSPFSSPTSAQDGRQQSSVGSLTWGSPLRGGEQGTTFRNLNHRFLRQARSYKPLPGNPILPLDVCADGFLKTKNFEAICKLAMEVACMIPTDPPPQVFLSLDLTAMHPWFESLVAVFTEGFAKRLRDRNAFPQKPTSYAAGSAAMLQDDHESFECELVAHVNAIFRSFNTNWAFRDFGSCDNILIDKTKPHASIAATVIRDVTEKASFPPKANWKVGETLHPFYQAQLRRFRGGVMRIIEDRPEDAWILTVPEQLERGVAGYEEYYVAHLRHKMLAHMSDAHARGFQGTVE